VISPHGRNNFGWGNAARYWQDLPAQGPFALVCPDGLGRAHDKASNPLDQPPHDPSLFTYGYRRWIDDLARMPSLWNERNPLNYVDRLARLPFPLRLFWSSHDMVVGNQAKNQTGKLYKQIKAKNRSADVKQVKGLWAHSCEFVPGDRLSDALRDFELIA
jgi:hypothetical protein